MEARNVFCGFFWVSWALKTCKKKNFDFRADFWSDSRSKNDCRFASFYVREIIFTWLERTDLGLSKNIRLVPVSRKLRELEPF